MAAVGVGGVGGEVEGDGFLYKHHCWRRGEGGRGGKARRGGAGRAERILWVVQVELVGTAMSQNQAAPNCGHVCVCCCCPFPAGSDRFRSGRRSARGLPLLCVSEFMLDNAFHMISGPSVRLKANPCLLTGLLLTSGSPDTNPSRAPPHNDHPTSLPTTHLFHPCSPCTFFTE